MFFFQYTLYFLVVPMCIKRFMQVIDVFMVIPQYWCCEHA